MRALAALVLASACCGCSAEATLSRDPYGAHSWPDAISHTRLVVVKRNGHVREARDSIDKFNFVRGTCPGEMYYMLMDGDSLYALAKRFNVPLEWLIRRNDIVDERELKPGLQLIVPRLNAYVPATRAGR